MNICYINPTNNIRRPIAELSNILSKKGHNITIIYPESKDCPTEEWVANETIKNQQIKTVAIPSWYFAPLRYSFPDPIKLIKEIKKAYNNNDKIHIWEYFYPLSVMPLLYSSLNKKNRQKTILTTDGFVGYSYKPKDPKWLVPLFKIYTTLFARFLFKIPRKMSTYGTPLIPYAKKAKVPLKKLDIISTGIHLNKFQNPDLDKVNQLKKDFNIKDEKIILYVGMLTERKGIDKVLKVSHKLINEGFNIKTILVGDAHGENIYKNQVKPEYQDKIIFAGGRLEISEFMKLSDILLLPSEGEGLPGVVMEAMASGLSVVATNEGCTPDLITNGVQGFLVNDGNYFLRIKQLLTSPTLKESFSTQAKKKIENFDWNIVTGNYEKLYQ